MEIKTEKEKEKDGHEKINDSGWEDGNKENKDDEDEVAEIEKINDARNKKFINVHWVKNNDTKGIDYVSLQATQCTNNGMKKLGRIFAIKDENAISDFLKLEPRITEFTLQHLLLRGVMDFSIKCFAEYYINSREQEIGKENGKSYLGSQKFIEEQRILSYMLDKQKIRNFKSHLVEEIKKVYKSRDFFDMNEILYILTHRDHQREQINRLIWDKIKKPQ